MEVVRNNFPEMTFVIDGRQILLKTVGTYQKMCEIQPRGIF
jgi:hypothetical protein